MTTLGLLTLGAAALGVLVTARLSVMFLRDPAHALAFTTHRAEALPRVMADRYVAIAGLALFALIYRDFVVIAAVYAAFSYMGFHDALIYAREGQPATKHLTAGFAGALVAVLALVTIVQTGAAS